MILRFTDEASGRVRPKSGDVVEIDGQLHEVWRVSDCFDTEDRSWPGNPIYLEVEVRPVTDVRRSESTEGR